MNSLFKTTGAAAALALAMGTAAQAQTITSGGHVTVGNNFTTTRGNGGYILFATTPAGTAGTNAGGNVDSEFQNNNPVSVTPVVQSGTTPPITATTINTILPTFAVIASQGIGNGPGYNATNNSGPIDFGNNSIGFGNDYAQIIPGLEAGYGGTFAGPAGGQSANIFRFTLGVGTPSNFTIGVLTDYAPPLTGAAAALRPNPAAFNLGSLTFSAGSVASPGSTVTQTDNNALLQQDFLFNVTGAQAGQTLYFSGFGGGLGQRVNGFEITTAATPEPSQIAAFGLGTLGLGLLGLKARRRTTFNA